MERDSSTMTAEHIKELIAKMSEISETFTQENTRTSVDTSIVVSESINLKNVNPCFDDAPVKALNSSLSIEEFYEKIKEIQDGKIPETRVIIEFCDDNLQYEAEPFYWDVTPGQDIDNSTVIAHCKQDETMKPVKSIFTKAHVEAIDEHNSDFLRTYKEYPCNRHIVLSGVETGSDVNIDSEKLIEMGKDFAQETSYFNLLTDVMNYCTLPEILIRRRNNDYKTFVLGVGVKWPDGQEIYEDWKKHIDETIKNFKESDDLQLSEQDIRNTGGEDTKIGELKDRILKTRDKFINGKHDRGAKKNGMIDLWRNYARKQDKCRADINNFADCRNLGMFYYLDILGRINLASDDRITHYVFDTISSIATERNLRERHTSSEIAAYINNFYKKHRDMLNVDIHNNDLVAHLDSNLNGSSSYTDVFNYLQNNSSKDDYSKIEKCRIVANIYIYYKQSYEKYQSGHIWDASNSRLNNLSYKDVSDQNVIEEISNSSEDPYEIIKKDCESPLDYYKLTVAEAMKLRQLWDNVIKDYKEKYNINDLIKNLVDYVSNDYAEWPTSTILWIDGQKYTYYYFDNIDAWKKLNRLNETPEIGDCNQDFNVSVPDNFGYELPKPPLGDDPFIAPDLDSGKTTYTIYDHEYWVKYFALATIVSVPFFATGIVIFGVPVLMPAIFCALVTIPVKQLNLVLVVGLSIRGIMIEPIMLWVNTDSQDLSALTPLVIALNKVKQLFDAKIDALESLVPNLADTLIAQLEEDNNRLTREKNELEIQAREMEALHFKGKELIKKQIDKTIKKMDPRQSIFRKETADKIPEEQ